MPGQAMIPGPFPGLLSELEIDAAKDWGDYGISNLGQVIIDTDNSEAFLVRKDGDGGDVFVVDTSGSQVSSLVDFIVEGKQVIDVDETEALLVRKDGDGGDVFIVDTINNHVYIGDRDDIASLSWRLSWGGGDTTTGVFWDSQWKNVTFDACSWNYKGSFFGFSNNLVAVNPGGFTFYSRYNDTHSNFNSVSMGFQAFDISDSQVANFFIRAAESGDWEFGYDWSNITFAVDASTKSLKISESVDFILGTTTGSKFGTTTSEKLGFFGTTPVVQPVALTSQLTTITHSSPGTPDYAIQNLTNSGPYGFVTQDEGNTVLMVIANLQTRLDELETKLQSLGLLA